MNEPEKQSYSNPDSFTRFFFNNIIENADLIHCISQHTRNQLIEFFKIDPLRTFVAYNGIKKIEIPRTSESKPNFTQEPFFLTVSRIEPRKNLVRLIQAFKEICKLPEFEEHKLFIIGKNGWGFEYIYNKIKELELSERVITLGFVSESELGLYYKNAHFYICPSITEGFGLPVLEAMSFGTPVVSSIGGALPEIAHSSTTFFDPHSVESMCSSIIEANLRRPQFDKGHITEHALGFSPRSMCEQILAGITPLLKNH